MTSIKMCPYRIIGEVYSTSVCRLDPLQVSVDIAGIEDIFVQTVLGVTRADLFFGDLESEGLSPADCPVIRWC